MAFDQSGEHATANVGTSNDVGRDQNNTTNNESFQNTVINSARTGAKTVRKVIENFGSRNVGNVIYNKEGDTFNSVSNTKSGDSINNSKNTAYINTGLSSAFQGLTSQASAAIDHLGDTTSNSNYNKLAEQIIIKEAHPESTVANINASLAQGGKGRKEISSELILNEACSQGEIITSGSSESCTKPLYEHAKGGLQSSVAPIVMIGEKGFSHRTGEKETSGGETAVIAAKARETIPQSDSLMPTFQSLTLRIRPEKYIGDGVAINIPYHFTPRLSLLQLEDGSCSVSISCNGLELSVSPSSEVLNENDADSRISDAKFSPDVASIVALAPPLPERSNLTIEKGFQVTETISSDMDVMKGSRIVEAYHKGSYMQQSA